VNSHVATERIPMYFPLVVAVVLAGAGWFVIRRHRHRGAVVETVVQARSAVRVLKTADERRDALARAVQAEHADVARAEERARVRIARYGGVVGDSPMASA
jgi:hypothetical protein